MAYLQVRDFPEELHEQLRILAKKEHRSVAQQTIVAIEECVARAAGKARYIQPFSSGVARRRYADEDNIARRQKVLERIRNTPKPEVPDDFPSITEIIQEGRDERDARIFDTVNQWKEKKQ